MVTGLGVCAPNGTGVEAFNQSLKRGQSGITHQPELAELKFRCQVAGVPQISEALMDDHFSALERRRLNANGVIYGILSGLEAWNNAGLDAAEQAVAWERGCVFGTGLSGVQTLREAIYKTDEGRVKRLGTAVVEQTMPSGISAYLGGRLGLGNWVSSNSSACNTGAEAVIMAADHIRLGRAKIMLAGGCDADGPYVWGGFDAMRVLNGRSNERPQSASRPLDKDANGFVPGSGAGALVLERLDSAEERGAHIYGEIIGSALNSGGQRGNGTMTAPNDEGVQRCIKAALRDAEAEARDIDLISGHLTSTMGDQREVLNWSQALNLEGKNFPRINAPKSLTGHCLSAAGAIELVACFLQLQHAYLHPSLNCEALHPAIAEVIDESCPVRDYEEKSLQLIAKASFGFGDVNSCLLLRKFTYDQAGD